MILLGDGLCSQAVVGLWADDCMLVVPAVDDCIAIAWSSRGAYEAQCHIEPGTYYLTESWIGPGDSPLDACDDLVKSYGEEKAQWLKD